MRPLMAVFTCLLFRLPVFNISVGVLLQTGQRSIQPTGFPAPVCSPGFRRVKLRLVARDTLFLIFDRGISNWQPHGKWDDFKKIKSSQACVATACALRNATIVEWH